MVIIPQFLIYVLFALLRAFFRISDFSSLGVLLYGLSDEFSEEN